MQLKSPSLKENTCSNPIKTLEEYEYDFKYFPTGISVVLRNTLIWSVFVTQNKYVKDNHGL